ncbi:MAG: T9SS type A sorting domain-containing protein [Bacteroidota bacterium]
MKNLKPMLFLVLLYLVGVTQTRAQLPWAHSFDISAAIPGASWQDISKVIKSSDDNYVVVGTLTGTNMQSVIVAKFNDLGLPVWLRELKGTPGSFLHVTDIAESKNPALPGFVVCGGHNPLVGGTILITHNYLARIDDLGNLLWDRSWHTTTGGAEGLKAVLFVNNAANDIITIGVKRNGITPTENTSIYKFDNAGNNLIRTLLDTDPNSTPVDIVEDPVYNGTGGFFILANFSDPVTGVIVRPHVIFVDYSLVRIFSWLIPYPGVQYEEAKAVRFERDRFSRMLYILTNTRDAGGWGREWRPSVIKFNPAIGAAAGAVVQAATGVMPAIDEFPATDIALIDGDSKKGIMVTANQHVFGGGGIKSYTWKLNNSLVTQSFFENQLWYLSNVQFSCLCVSKDKLHYLLVGRDPSLNLTLNMVDLNGDKIDLAGVSPCTDPHNPLDEPLNLKPYEYSTSQTFHTISPFSETTSDEHSWWYANACACAELPATTYFRHAYPGIAYQAWELDINRATYNPATGNVYITNTKPKDAQFFKSGSFVFELNAAGQNTNTWHHLNDAYEEEGRQALIAGNGDLVIASRLLNTPGNPPVLNIVRTPAAGPITWQNFFPYTQSPGHVYMAEAVPAPGSSGGDIIVVADINGPDANANTHDLMICRMTSGGGVIYYREIPIAYNGNPRNHFKVLSLIASDDGGYVLTGSSGEDGDFVAGHVMKFDAGGSSTGTLAWQYVFRRQTGGNCYNLGNPACRSASVLYAAHQDGSDYYVAGYTSDHDQTGSGATFWNGLLVKLDANGNELAIQEYANNNMDYTTFKGITSTGNTIAVVGGLRPLSGGETDLFVQIDKTTLSLLTANSYGINGNTTLLDVFVTTSGSGYALSGTTTDWGGVRTPQLISVDATGSTRGGCEVTVPLSEVTPVNDPPVLDLGTPVDHFRVQTTDYVFSGCVDVYDICIPAPAPPMPSGLMDQDSREGAEIVAYPNPAFSQLNIDLHVEAATTLTVSLYDMQGRKVMTRNETVAAGRTQLKLDLSGMNKGLYLLKAEDSTGKQYRMLKVLKQ